MTTENSLKSKIERNFDAASSSYEKVASVQRDSAENLTNMILKHFDGKDFRSILDVGAGTGYMSQELLKYFPNADYSVNDISAKMIEAAKKKFINQDNFRFYKGDVEEIEIAPHQLIVSNFSLQWAQDLEKAITNLYNKSDILAFSSLLFGTFSQWEKCLESYGIFDAIKTYPKGRDLLSFTKSLSAKEQYYEIKDFSLHFESPLYLMKYLKSLGANGSNSEVDNQKLRRLIKDYNKPCTLNYKIIFLMLKRS